MLASSLSPLLGDTVDARISVASNRVTVLLLLLLLPLLMACGADSSFYAGDQCIQQWDAEGWPYEFTDELDEQLAHDLSPTLEVTFNEAGDLAFLELTIENTTDQLMVLDVGGAPVHNFQVVTPDCKVVWTWVDKFLLPSSGWWLVPGEQVTRSAEWGLVDDDGAPIPSGAYRVYGHLLSVQRASGPDEDGSLVFALGQEISIPYRE